MYPSALFSRPHSIDYHAEDKEMFLHLDNMMHGAPHPQNVLTDVDVDPYAVAPWNLPPNMLYFINSDHDISLEGEKGIKATEGGYWFSRTWTQTPTMGRVTTKEFFRGKAPHGEKTDWVMKEYTMDKFSGSSSLCKVFELQTMLLRMLEDEENISGFQSLSNMSQVLSRNKNGPPVISASHLQNLRPNVWVPGEDDFLEEKDLVGTAFSSSLSLSTNKNGPPVISASHLQNLRRPNVWVPGEDDFLEEKDLVGTAFSSALSLSTNKNGPPVISASHSQNLRPNVWLPGEDDFLEEKDLVGTAFSSSLSSENTWVSSMTLNDEYFDPEDLLRERTPSIEDTTNKQNVDCCRATGSASQGSHQVHIQPPPSGSVGGSGSSSNKYKNPLVMKTVVSASVPSFHIGGLNHTHQPAASVKELPNKKIVGRITKLVKKYICFM